jgi:E1A-binding protein p400
MIMNDFDDEQTMEEEEALESQEDNDDEINALNEEQDMPLEELMKLYNYGGGAQASPPTVTDASKKKGKKKKKKHREQAKAQKREYDDSKDDTQIENQSPEKENNGLDVSYCHISPISVIF